MALLWKELIADSDADMASLANALENMVNQPPPEVINALKVVALQLRSSVVWDARSNVLVAKLLCLGIQLIIGIDVILENVAK